MENDARRQDDILIGRLIQSVETLTQEVAILRTEVSEIKEASAKGKGFIFGLLLFSGGVGAALAQALQGLLK